jgi:hypothetical protein
VKHRKALVAKLTENEALRRAGPMNGTRTTKLLATPPYRFET